MTGSQPIRWAIAALLFVAAPTLADDIHPGMTVVTGPKDPVCGFTKAFRYLEEDQSRPGLGVEMSSPKNVQTGDPVTLRFYVDWKPGSVALKDLQIEHEKYLHVIGVRDDLGEFFHIHPVNVAPGIWEVSHVFTNGGAYKIWSDVRFQDVSYAVGHPILNVAGNHGQAAASSDRSDYVVRSGYQITFKHTEPLAAGRSATLEFLIRDAAGREAVTDNFLGAPMHLVIIKDDLSVYLHAHPEHQENPVSLIGFTQIFPREGRYKLFAQFRPKGVKFAADDAILAEFYVDVASGPSLTAAPAAKSP